MVTETDQNSEDTSQEVDTSQGGEEVDPLNEDNKPKEIEGEEESSESDEKEEAGHDTEAKKVAPAYTPNYKLKVYDVEKDLEDPLLKSLIKDADSEKKVKEIAQKYLGFDTVKERLEQSRGDFSAFKEQSKPAVEAYSSFQKMYQKGDLDGIFGLLNIPQQAIFQYAVKKAEELQLPPEQQQALAYQREVAKRAENLEQQNQQLMHSQQAQLAQFRNQELSWVMARPDVQSVATAYDQKVGTPGAFKKAVVDKGLAHYAATQQDLTAEQAVQEVMKFVGAFVTPMTTAGPATPMNQLIQQGEAPPIIPNVASRGSSPVKKQPRSIADLKKLRESVSG